MDKCGYQLKKKKYIGDYYTYIFSQKNTKNAEIQ
jgi:hypothetical protein